MKHYLDLVPISEKVHQKQSKMSIFCIILAVLLVTTIFGMADMFIRSQILKAQAEGGNWHIAIKNISDQDAKILSLRLDVAATSFYGIVNFYGTRDYTLNGTNTSIAGSDKAFVTDILSGMLKEGEFPDTTDEALVSLNAKEMLGLQIGDQIEIDSLDGSAWKFKISGFLGNTSNIMSSDSYVILLSKEGYRKICSDIGGAVKNIEDVFYIQFRNAKNIQNKISDLKSELSLTDEQVIENPKLLGLLGQSRTSFMMQTYAAAAVLFVLVLCAAIMMIASSLNSNVAQRTEFFGLIRCVGATPRQVMRLVYKEALRWCRFAIPVGVGLGIVIIWILCAILRILSPVYFGTMPAFSISMPSIIMGIVVGVLTVFLATRSPAKKAAKVSPLAAVSGNASDLYPAKKAANTHLFKVDIALGIHHAKSSRKNFILTVLSFALSIILFLSFSVTITFMNHSLTPLYPWTADISIVSEDNTCSVNQKFVQELRENPAVESVYGRMFLYDVPISVNGLEGKIDLVSYEQRQFSWSKEYLQEGSIDEVQTKRNTGLLVYKPQNTIQVGDSIIMDIGGKMIEIEIVGLLSVSPFHNNSGVDIVICSEETFRQATGQSDYTIIDMQLDSNATDSDVNAIHQAYGEGYTFIDERMNNESTVGVYYCIWLFLYGFLVLIALITVLNVINTISLSVSARTKQYGIFRAIGLSTRQLFKMVIAEALTYAVVGSIVGAVLGLFCHNLLFDLLINYNWGDPWTIPWKELGIIIFLVIISVILAVFGPIKKIRDMSIVDTIHAQ